MTMPHIEVIKVGGLIYGTVVVNGTTALPEITSQMQEVVINGTPKHGTVPSSFHPIHGWPAHGPYYTTNAEHHFQ
jgi:hypothetical protein